MGSSTRGGGGLWVVLVWVWLCNTHIAQGLIFVWGLIEVRKGGKT